MRILWQRYNQVVRIKFYFCITSVFCLKSTMTRPFVHSIPYYDHTVESFPISAKGTNACILYQFRGSCSEGRWGFFFFMQFTLYGFWGARVLPSESLSFSALFILAEARAFIGSHDDLHALLANWEWSLGQGTHDFITNYSESVAGLRFRLWSGAWKFSLS